jgi:hypothetical protein
VLSSEVVIGSDIVPILFFFIENFFHSSEKNIFKLARHLRFLTFLFVVSLNALRTAISKKILIKIKRQCDTDSKHVFGSKIESVLPGSEEASPPIQQKYTAV